MPSTQFLDQLCPRSFVFDQNELRFMKAREIEDGTFEAWEIEFAAKDIEQVEGAGAQPPKWCKRYSRKARYPCWRYPSFGLSDETVPACHWAHKTSTIFA